MIIPTYNRHAELQRAVGSALTQTFACHEIIVIDDGSAPPVAGTGNLADSRIRIIRSASNSGAAAARNIGISAARGSILAFLDSDDAWYPSKLEEQLAFLNDGDLQGVVSGFDLRDRFKSKALGLVPHPASDIAQFAGGCWFSPGTTLLIRKAAFEAIGRFEEKLRRLEDYEWFLRFGMAGGKLTVVPRILAAIDVSGDVPGDMSGGGRPDAVKAAGRLIRERYDGRLPRAVFRRVIAYTALVEASGHMRAKHLSRTILPLIRSLIAVPRIGIHLQPQFAVKSPSRPDSVSDMATGTRLSRGSEAVFSDIVDFDRTLGRGLSLNHGSRARMS